MREAKTKVQKKIPFWWDFWLPKNPSLAFTGRIVVSVMPCEKSKKKAPANAVEIDLTPSPPKIRNTPQNTPYNKPNSQAKNPQEWREVNSLDKGKVRKVLKFLTKMISSLGTSFVINVPGYYLTAEKRPGI